MAVVGAAGCDREEDPAPAGSEPAAGPAVVEPSAFELPGERFFPEGIAAAADGRLFIGSLATGEIVVRSPGGRATTTFIPAGTDGMKGAVGLTVDAKRGLLWVCAADVTFQSPAAIKSFDLASGAPRSSAVFPPRAICNDLTIDGRGDVYMTDSFGGTIYRLPSGEAAVRPWLKDPAFVGPPGEHSINGIVWDGKGSLYTARTDTGALFRVPIGADGSPGAPVKIALDAPLGGPDGIFLLDPRTLLVAEHSAGRVVRLTLDGDAARVTTIATDLVEPTTLAVVGPDAWIVEGQLASLFDPTAELPKLPFRVQRVAMP
jgi:sugar lactone lactonase YvrE